MRAITIAVVAVVLLALLPPAAWAITREDVVRLSKSGMSDEVILAVVDRDKTIFALTSEDLVALKKEGVSEAVVLAMLKSGRDEGEAAFAQQSAQAAADRDAAVWLAPNVVVIGHGPDRPNSGYRDGQYAAPRPWPLYGDYFPSYRRSLCVAQVAARPGHAAFQYVTECPPQVQRRSSKLPR